MVLAADQTPQYSNVRKAGHEGGDFIFVSKGSTVVVVTPPDNRSNGNVDTETLDHSFWEAAKEASAREAYEAYLDRFSNGVYAVLAQLKLRSFAERAPAPASGKSDLGPSSADNNTSPNATQNTEVASLDPRERTRGLLVDYFETRQQRPKERGLFLSRLYQYDVRHDILGADYDSHTPVPTKLLGFDILGVGADYFRVCTRFTVVGRDRSVSRQLVVHMRQISGCRIFDVVGHE